MDDWDKFNYTNEPEREFVRSAPKSEPQTYVNYGSYSEASTAQPKYVTRKMLIIALIICMLLSAFVGAACYALAMSAFGGATVDKTIKTTN